MTESRIEVVTDLPPLELSDVLLSLNHMRILAMTGGVQTSSEAWREIDRLLDVGNMIGWVATNSGEPF